MSVFTSFKLVSFHLNLFLSFRFDGFVCILSTFEFVHFPDLRIFVIRRCFIWFLFVRFVELHLKNNVEHQIWCKIGIKSHKFCYAKLMCNCHVFNFRDCSSVTVWKEFYKITDHFSKIFNFKLVFSTKWKLYSLYLSEFLNLMHAALLSSFVSIRYIIYL